MLELEITYDPATRELSIPADKYAGTTIDNISASITITGLPIGYDARLDFAVDVIDINGDHIRPFLELDALGTCILPEAILSQASRDKRLPFQLVLRKGDEVIASKNVITLEVSRSINALGIIEDVYTPYVMLRNESWGWIDIVTYSEGTVVTYEGDIYVSLVDGNLGNLPTDATKWKNVLVNADWEATEGDAYILNKPYIIMRNDGIVPWDATIAYNSGAICRVGGVLYASVISNNLGHDPTESTTYWTQYNPSGVTPTPQDVFLTIIGDGVSADITVTHNLNSLDVIGTLYTQYGNLPTVGSVMERLNVNQVRFRFAEVPTSNSLRVIIQRPGTSVSSVMVGDTAIQYGAVVVTRVQLDVDNVDNTSDADKPVSTAQQTALDGKANLVGGKVPASELPSYVDDVIDSYIVGSTPFAVDWLSESVGGSALTPTTGKIYIILTAGGYENREYRWSGTVYVEVSQGVQLGESSSTAYRGDRGKTAYDHSQMTSGNPHNVTKSDVGLGTTADGAQVNVIESVKLNGAALPITSKAVDITVPVVSITTPIINGTAAIGDEGKWADGKHVHPTDATRFPLSQGMENAGKTIVVDETGNAVPIKKTYKGTITGNGTTKTFALDVGILESIRPNLTDENGFEYVTECIRDGTTGWNIYFDEPPYSGQIYDVRVIG